MLGCSAEDLNLFIIEWKFALMSLHIDQLCCLRAVRCYHMTELLRLWSQSVKILKPHPTSAYCVQHNGPNPYSIVENLYTLEQLLFIGVTF